MGLFSFNKKKSSESISKINQNLYIKQITINSTRDFTVLKHHLLDGNVMICNLKPLVKIAQRNNGDKQELHDYLQKIKRYCISNGGSASKIDESVLLVTPNSNIKIKNNL